MKRSYGFLSEHKLAAAMCAVLVCLSIVFGAFISVCFSSTPENKQDFSPSSASSVAQPLREYTSLELSVPDDFVIYTLLTTASDFKSSVTVTGTYMSEQGEVKQELAADEYVVYVDGKAVTDRFYDAELTAEPTEDGEPSDEKPSKVIMVEVGCGSADARDTVTVKNRSEIPEFSGITVDEVKQIEDDHTPATLKDLLVVRGKSADGTSTIIRNKELYKVEIDTALLAGRRTSITVTYLYGTDESGKALTAQLSPMVTEAAIERISVKPSDKLELVDGVYMTNINGKKYCAFVAGMTRDEVLSRLDVTLHYQNSHKSVFGEDGGVIEGMTCSVTSSSFTSNPESARTEVVNVTVIDNNKQRSYGGTVTLRFEALRVVEIEAKYKSTSNQTFKSSTPLSPSDFIVIPTYNNGEKREDEPLSETLYGVDTALTPEDEDIDAALEALAGGAEKYYYDKWVRVEYKDNNAVFCRTLFKDVEYEAPNTILYIEGDLARQTIFDSFKYDGLYVYMRYADGMRKSAPLNQLKSYCSVELRDENQVKIESDTITRDVRFARITFTYPGKDSYTETYPVSVDKASYDWLDIGGAEIDFSGDCVKNIAGVDASIVNAEHAANIRATVSEKGVAGEVGAVYTAKTETADGSVTPITNAKVGATFDETAGSIRFLRGGVFTLKIELTDGENGDYWWAVGTSSANLSRTDYVLTYTITVNKGELDVRLTYDGKETIAETMEYGDFDPDRIGISLRTVGSGVKVNEEIGFTLYYYGFDGHTYSAPVTAPDKFGAGTYRVIAVTDDTAAYVSSKTFSGFSLLLTVTPKSVSADGVFGNKTYSRHGYAAADFIDLDACEFLPDDFVGGKPPVSITAVTAAESDGTYFHVGGYTVKLTITDSNYKWKNSSDDTVATAAFYIEKAPQSVEITVPAAFASFEYETKASDLTQPAASHTAGSKYPFAAISAAKYYAADDSGNATGDPLDAYEVWSVGNYVVVFETSPNTAAGDKAGDYDCEPVQASFSIYAKALDEIVISFTESNPTYDSYAHLFKLINLRDDVMDYKVEGVTFDGDDIASGIVCPTANVGEVSVIDAGTYTVTVSFKADAQENYVWKNTSGASVERTYTLNRRVIELKWNKDEEKFDFVEGMSPAYPNIRADNNVDADNLSLIRAFYGGSTLSEEIAEAALTKAGRYRIEIIGIEGSRSHNYVLPSDAYVDFVIGYAAIDVPVLVGSAADNVTVASPDILEAVYRGGVYKFLNYVANSAAYTDSTVIVRLYLGGKEVDCISGFGEYIVTVEPSENYVWDNAEESKNKLPQEYKFKVEKAEIGIDWGVVVFEYDGSGKLPSPSATGLFACDSGKVEIAAELYGGGEAVDAGAYIAVAVALSGKDGAENNYKLPADKNGGFTILKKALARPSDSANATAVFDEESRSVVLSDTAYWQSLFAVGVASRVSADDWLNASISNAGLFTVEEGKLSYTKAGKYTVTLTLDTPSNYCFKSSVASDSYESYKDVKTVTLLITVERMELDAPVLVAKTAGAKSTMLLWNGGVQSPDWETSLDEGLFDIYYGKVEKDGTGTVSYPDGSAQCASADRDEYYLQFKLKAGAIDPYNYIFKKPANADDKDGSILTRHATVVYDSDGVSIYLHYAITNTVLNVEFAFGEYTFGDNANALLSDELLSVRDVVSSSGDASALAAENAAGRLVMTATFTASSGAKSGFTYKSADKSFADSDSAGMLENHLPWEEGEYSVVIALSFIGDSNYQAQEYPASLKVKPLEITAVWSATEGVIKNGDVFETTYDFNSHTLNAVISNAPVRGGADSGEGIALAVALADGVSLPVNVLGDEQAYTLYVVGISGEGAHNFTYGNSSETYSSGALLKIKRRSVDVKGVAVTDYIYGDSLPIFKWTSQDKEFEAVADGKIGARAERADGGVIADRFTPAQTSCFVVPYKINPEDGFFNDFDISIDRTAAFTVNKREITLTINGGIESTYGENPVDLNAEENAARVYTVGGDGLAVGQGAADVFTLAFVSAVTSTTNVGSYKITYAQSNDNYDIAFDNESEYTVKKATVKVTVTLGIIYGEENPADIDGGGTVWLGENSDLMTNSVYTFDGFVNGDETAFRQGALLDFGGSFKYTTSYNKGDDAGEDYTVIFDGSLLTSKNYEFADGGNGSLSVGKLVLSVKVKNATAVYNAAASKLKVEYDVELPVSTYDGNKTVSALLDYSEIFTLTTDAFTPYNSKTTTNKVGKHPIYCDLIAGLNKNYGKSLTDESGKENPMFEITPATLANVATVSNREVFYNEDLQDVIAPTRGGVAVETYASAVDGCLVETYFRIYNDGDAALNDFDFVSLGTKTMPAVRDVGTYTVYYLITAENHDEIRGSVTFKVKQAENGFEFAEGFLFANKSDRDMKDGFGGVGTLIQKDGGYAWVYGVYDERENRDGYNADGAQKSAMPATTFKLGAGDIITELYFYATASTADKDAVPLGSGGDFAELVKSILEAADKNMGAGYYRVRFYREGNANFTDAEANRIFSVAKKPLSVTPDAKTIFYGDDKPEFTYEYSGFAYNGFKTETAADAALSHAPRFDASYAAGDNAGGDYEIEIANENDCLSANYELEFFHAKLTVDKRVVTVTIGNNKTFFDFTGVSETDRKAVSELVYTTGENDIFGGEKPITLVTEALDACEESDNTNNAADYPIYAVWNKAAGEKDHENNYTIRFKNCKGSFDGDALEQPEEYAIELGRNNAGVFTIERVTLHITYNFDNPTYDGKEREAAPVVSGGNDKIKFITVYYSYDDKGFAAEMTGSKPVDVGSYAFEFIYDSEHENYISSVTRQNFKIEKTPVDVTVKNTRIVYGAPLSDVLTDGDDGDVEYNVYYKGEWLKEESASLIAKEKDKGKSYFDVSGLTYSSEDYTANSPADRNYHVTAGGITAKNYDLRFVTSDALSVNKRDVTVTVRGIESVANGFAKGYYGDDHQANLTQMLKEHPEAFLVPKEVSWNGESGDALAALNITLGVNAKNVGEYDVIFDVNANVATNYNVTFDTSSAPKYAVEKKTIKGYVYGRNTDGEYTAAFTVIYGETAYFKVRFDENDFEYNEDYDRLIRIGAASGEAVAVTAYTPWTSGVGFYTVTFKGAQSTLSFDNYAIDYVEKRFEVVARKVTASAASKEYSPILDNYNGGADGQAKGADVVFANAKAGLEAIAAAPVLGADYTLTYFDLTTNRQLSGEPAQAGDYNVTVTLITNNFVFEGTNVVAYKVTKREIVIGWNPISLSEYGEGVTASVDDYIKDIMNIDENGFYRQYNLTSPRPPIEAIAEEYFTAGNDGLELKVYATGEYHLSLTLNVSAQRNYVFKSGETESVSVHLVLRVSAEKVTLEVNIVGWTYGEFDADVNYPETTLNGGSSDSSDMIQYYYATIVAPIPSDFDTSVGFDDSHGELNSLGLNSGSFGSRRPENAGNYVVQAYYPATYQSAFRVFTIERAQVEAPTLELISAGDGRNDTYTGGELTLSVEFDNDALIMTSTLSFVSTASGARLSAVNANRYEVVFTLRSNNYKWKDISSLGDALSADGSVKRVWTVKKGTAEIIFDRAEYTTTYGVTNFAPSVTVSFGAKPQFLYKTVIANDTRGENEGWLSYVEGAGRYRIMATVVGTDNYDEVSRYAYVTVEKAVLNAAAVGSMTYGEGSGVKLDYRFDESGFVGGDTIENSKPSYSGGVSYLIEIGGIFEELENVDLSALGAGSYRIKLKESNGEVAGLFSNNYAVISAVGELVIGKKSITVRIGIAESVYGDEIGQISAPMTVTGASIDASILKISSLYLENVESLVKLAAGTYTISASGYDNGNYDVKFVTGIYTVKPREVEIGAIASDGGEVGSIKNATVQTILDVTNPNDKVPVNDSEVWSALTYTYTGTSDGSRPNAAGSYYVTIGIADTNYTLIGQTSFAFNILRRGIDPSEIAIAAVAYSGSTIEPVIDFGRYSASDFAVEYFGERKNVGFYYVVLTLADFENMRWLDSDIRAMSFTFEITQSKNELVSLSIEGWTYGEKENAPTAVTKFGSQSDYAFTYYDENGVALVGVPTAAGRYSVRVTVQETRNYTRLESEGFTFEIAKAVKDTPTLGIVASGDGKNDTYTGQNLSAQVVGFDSTSMEIFYDGISDIGGGSLWVYALNAGKYRIELSLKDSDNYRWSDGTKIENGKAVLEWEIYKKKVAVPSADKRVHVVNGSVLVYMPEGFDESIMGISGNTTGYGGDHDVTVFLLDPDNYEWEEGGTSSFIFVWHVVGGETVFAIVTATLGALALVAGVCALVQFLSHKRRLKMRNDTTVKNGGKK